MLQPDRNGQLLNDVKATTQRSQPKR